MLTALLALQGVVMAQARLFGTVTDLQTGQAVQGAHLQLEGTQRTTFTDARGQFGFQSVPEGRQVIRITHISYKTLTDTVTVRQEAVTLTYRMETAIHLSEELVVRAVRSDQQLTGAATMVTREDLKQLNLGQDLPMLLATAPSVVSSSEAGTGIGYTGMRIRGIDQNRINVTINGVPLNDPESHSVYWVDLPDFASSAEDIQIQRGVGTSTNGPGAFGGSVNILTGKLQGKAYAATSHSFGSFSTLRNSVAFGSGLLGNRFAFDGRISSIASDGYIDRASSDLASGYLSGGYYGQKTVLKAIMMTGHEVTYQAWGGVPSEVLDTHRTYNPMGLYTDANGVLKAYPNQKDDYRQTHYQLHLIQELGHDFTANATLFLTTGNGFYEEYKESQELFGYGLPDVINGNDTLTESNLIRQKWLDNRFYGLTGSVRKGFSGGGSLTVGGAVSRYFGDHFGRLLWLQHQGSVEKDHEWYRGTGDKRDYNVYAKYLWFAGRNTTLFADLQFRYIDYEITGIDDDLRNVARHETYPFLNPKAGISYRHNDRHETWAMTGIAHREPNRSNFTDAKPGAPVPRPERLYNLEVGHRIKGNRWSAEANGYLMYYRDQLVMTGEINDVGSPVMTNVDSSYRMGLELSGGIQILPMVLWEANLTLSVNKILHFNEFVDDWDTWEQHGAYLGTTDIAFSPSVIAGNSLRITPFKGAMVTLISQHVGKQYLDNTRNETRKLDPWFVNHLHLQYSITPRLFRECRFNLMIANIFNEKYESNGWVYSYFENGQRKQMDGLFPQAGIHFLAGVTLGF